MCRRSRRVGVGDSGTDLGGGATATEAPFASGADVPGRLTSESGLGVSGERRRSELMLTPGQNQRHHYGDEQHQKHQQQQPNAPIHQGPHPSEPPLPERGLRWWRSGHSRCRSRHGAVSRHARPTNAVKDSRLHSPSRCQRPIVFPRRSASIALRATRCLSLTIGLYRAASDPLSFINDRPLSRCERPVVFP